MKFNLTAHKELWNWLADNPEKAKINWPGWKCNGGKYNETKMEGLCFACQYSVNISGIFGACRDCCPLDYYAKGEGCLKGLFDKWDDAGITIERSEFARQIANLPVREGVECE